jgi:hypothetical protein
MEVELPIVIFLLFSSVISAICAGYSIDTHTKSVAPSTPTPLKRIPSGNLRREEVKWMSPPYG